MSFIKKHLASFLIGFLSLTIVGAGAAALNKAPLAPTVECDHYVSTVTEHGTATCTDGGSSGTLICSKCKVTLQNDHTVGPLGHKYLAGKCVRCDMNEADDLEYKLSADGTYYTVVGPGGYESSVLEFPEKHNDLPVIGIASYAFSGVTNLGEDYTFTTLQIGRHIQFIGEGAFTGCDYLESVSFSGQDIPESCLNGCYNLTSVYLDNVHTIGVDAFAYTGLRSINLDGVSVIESGAFTDCYSLQYVYFGQDLNEIQERAFEGCTSLTEIDYDGDRMMWNQTTIMDDKINYLASKLFEVGGAD